MSVNQRIVPAVLCLSVLLFVDIPLQAVESFPVGIELPTQFPITPALEAALRELGIDAIDYHACPSPQKDNIPVDQVNRTMMELCDRLGLDYALMCSPWELSPETIRQSRDHAVGSEKGAFLGVIWDEMELFGVLNPWSQPLVADARKATSLEEAYELTVKGYEAQLETIRSAGSPRIVATHVWPIMHHISAKTGYTVCPKICKEFYSPVNLAVAMGAALQYRRDLWVDCDLWYWGALPGHSAEEFRCNLLLAYWIGADRLYVEGVGYNLDPTGKQGSPFSLISLIDENRYQFTEHGEVLRWFCREYLPSHPRPWTFRDIKPGIAIIRFEDTCHGQRFTADWPDNLYGSPQLHSTADTEAWFALWNLLTHGATGRDGLSFFKVTANNAGYQYLTRQSPWQSQLSHFSQPLIADRHSFFVPLNNVVVFDHLVEYERLKGIPLLFLTGTDVSDATLEAIRRCVNEGTTCVAWGPLAQRKNLAGGDWNGGVSTIVSGKGRFILTDDFENGKVFKAIEAWSHEVIGWPDEIRYKFSNYEMILHRIDDNQVQVEINPPIQSPQ